MNPWMKFDYNGKGFQTHVKHEADKTPQWSQMFKIPLLSKEKAAISTDKVTFTVLDKEAPKDHEVCTGEITMVAMFADQDKEMIAPLMWKEKKVGEFHWRTSWQPAPQKTINESLKFNIREL